MPVSLPQQRNTRQNKWLFCAGVAVFAALLTCWPQGLMLFRYDRAALLQGEGWRLFSAHLVHLNRAHLVLNLIGLLLIGELLWRDLPIMHGVGILLASALGIDALLWHLHPALAHYAGLSGALHGLWSACALAACWPPAALRSSSQRQDWPAGRNAGAAGIVLLLGKLASEWQFGPAMHTETLIGAPVITDAHFYGAIMGVVYMAVLQALAWLRQKMIRRAIFD